MPSDTQERLTPGQTFVDAAGRRRWKSRVSGMPNVEADAFEEEVQDTLLSAAPPSFTLEDLPATRPPSPEALTALRGLYARAGRALPETLRPTELETARAEDPFAGATPKFTLEPVSEASPARSLAQALPTAPTTTDLSIEERVARALSGEAPAEAETASPLESVPLTEQQLALARARYAGRDLRGGSAPSKAQETPSAAVTTPVPFARASPVSDQAGVKTGTIAATTSLTAAPPADTAAKPGVPAPQTKAGGDAMDRLGLGEAFVRALEGSGSIIAGRDLRSGAAETLAERMKQIEALRAKREEQGLEQQRERATWGASNRATLASFMAQYKDRPEVVEALRAQEPGADTTKPSDFLKNIVGSLTTPPKVAGIEAKTKTEEGKPDIAKGGLEVKRGTLAERERSNKANEEIRRQALLVKKASDTKTADEIRAAGSDPKAAERAITRAMETAESDKLGIAGNIRDFQGLEKVAPGFTRGTVPSWLGQGGIEAARKVPALNKQAAELASALETFIAGIRKSLFGASLTGNEKASFDAIASSGLLMPPDVLAANINRLREGAAKFAQNHFTVAQTLHPEVTRRVLGASTLFGPALAKDGIYSDVWTLPVAPAATDSATVSAPSARSVDALKKDPSTLNRQYFDEQFGPGAAKKALGE